MRVLPRMPVPETIRAVSQRLSASGRLSIPAEKGRPCQTGWDHHRRIIHQQAGQG